MYMNGYVHIGNSFSLIYSVCLTLCSIEGDLYTNPILLVFKEESECWET